jgi:hypothetical protein
VVGVIGDTQESVVSHLEVWKSRRRFDGFGLFFGFDGFGNTNRRPRFVASMVTIRANKVVGVSFRPLHIKWVHRRLMEQKSLK